MLLGWKHKRHWWERTNHFQIWWQHSQIKFMYLHSFEDLGQDCFAPIWSNFSEDWVFVSGVIWTFCGKYHGGSASRSTSLGSPLMWGKMRHWAKLLYFNVKIFLFRTHIHDNICYIQDNFIHNSEYIHFLYTNYIFLFWRFFIQ